MSRCWRKNETGVTPHVVGTVLPAFCRIRFHVAGPAWHVLPGAGRGALGCAVAVAAHEPDGRRHQSRRVARCGGGLLDCRAEHLGHGCRRAGRRAGHGVGRGGGEPEIRHQGRCASRRFLSDLPGVGCGAGQPLWQPGRPAAFAVWFGAGYGCVCPAVAGSGCWCHCAGAVHRSLGIAGAGH